MNYAIKQVPEDFEVEEIPAVKPAEEGDYAYFIMEKKGLNTIRAVRLVARALGIRIERIGWAGNKDKNAVTRQVISLQGVSRERAENVSIEGVKLSYFGRGSERIFIGNLAGNRFCVVIRNLSLDDCRKISGNLERLRKIGFLAPNYFDEQRFGGNNAEVGKALLMRDFGFAAREIYRKEADNPLAALRRVHKSSLSLYVHAYQSLLFNETLSEYIRSSGCGFSTAQYSRGEFLFPSARIENMALPVVGFCTELGGDAVAEAARNVLRKHKLTQRDFIIKQLPELSVEGAARDAFVKADNLEVGKPEDDELNSGMKKLRIRFSLPKGSYATIVVKALTS